jgi:polyisoprenoid-binding protein YceI
MHVRRYRHAAVFFTGLSLLFISPVNALPISAEKSKAEIQIYPRLPMPSQGQFSEVSGQIELLPDQMNKVEVILDARKIHFSGPAWLSRMAQSKAFLDVETYPVIRFSSETFSKQLLHNGGDLKGELFLRGQARAVSFTILPPACSEPGHRCPLKVQGEVNRRDYGMKAYRFSVKDAVNFEFTIFFEQKAP